MKELAKDMMMGSIAWWLLLAALAGIAVLWNLYLKEKRKTASEFVVYVALPLAEQSQIEEKENQEQETVRKVVVPDLHWMVSISCWQKIMISMLRSPWRSWR